MDEEINNEENIINEKKTGPDYSLVSSFFVFIVMASVFVWGVTAFLGGEREGVIDYEDCREIVTLKPDDLQRYYKKFTCSYTKTNSGKIARGFCSRIVLKEGLCRTAYVYEKKSEIKCSEDYPYLDLYDEKCYNIQNDFYSLIYVYEEPI